MVNRCYKSYINLYQSSYFSKYVNKAIYKLGKYNKGLLYVNKISAFVGMKGKGLPVCTIVRGNVVAEDGKITAEKGVGTFIAKVN